MSTETKIRTRHEFVESSEDTDHTKEKASQAHKDRGQLLDFMEDYNRINKSLLAELHIEQDRREAAEYLLDAAWKKSALRKKLVEQQTPTGPRLH